jgi:hypothetical protein
LALEYKKDLKKQRSKAQRCKKSDTDADTIAVTESGSIPYIPVS